MIIDLTYELDRLEKEGVIDAIKSILNNLLNPEFLNKVSNLLRAISQTQFDNSLADQSLIKILKGLNNYEVKKGLLYVSQLIKEISKQ